MEELYNLGITEEAMNYLIELNPSLKELKSNEINEKIRILKQIGCSRKMIKNIIESNPFYLDKTNIDILNLFELLITLGFNLNILFDSNPYILNLEPFEINNYINEKIKEGKSIEDIVDELDSNPFLFNEI